MAYEQVYKGQAPVGPKITHDNGPDFTPYSYQPTEAVYAEEWVTKWQPEHVPVGTVLRYNTSMVGAEKDLEVTVTGHQWNGPHSWVVLTNDPCPIRGSEDTASFHYSHIRSIVSRGNGKVNWRSYKADDYYRNEYLANLPDLQKLGIKTKHTYAAHRVRTIVGFVLANHPAFSDMMDSNHLYNSDIYSFPIEKLDAIFEYTALSQWHGYYSVSKKKLIKELKKRIPRLRVSRKKTQREDDDHYRDLLEEHDA
ncbi:hypothetical protein MZD04_gp159 [Pseudomonas phage Psa21]|uniref:Uncharacterized protein n=1 Tax=Pseudomonas phage Psa21 TaxID=2530023 RepID=A0A481W4K0_9CAUD|nr:hypothetical protein MZD04_gp159 [Pseudomonas phage Psa21]QBJ02686.1 hypothetical protein PSA21_159 [Pseudomonas phage Psa21]